MAADQARIRTVVDSHFKKMRGKIFSLAEASLPESQAEGFKKTVRQYTQMAWKSILRDLDVNLNDVKEDEDHEQREQPDEAS